MAEIAPNAPEAVKTTREEIGVPLKSRFERLAEEWKRDRGPSSSLSEIADHPAYKEIIRMGKPVLPYVLASLEREPDFWFAALRRITKENPVTPDIRGNFHGMVKAWLRWGREHNVRW